jgi:hypothetical protein
MITHATFCKTPVSTVNGAEDAVGINLLGNAPRNLEESSLLPYSPLCAYPWIVL